MRYDGKRTFGDSRCGNKKCCKLINLITDFLPFVFFICSSIKDTKISLKNRYLMYFKMGAIDESKRRAYGIIIWILMNLT